MRSPSTAANGAMSAAGASCAIATTPAVVAPPMSKAKRVIASQIAYSSALKRKNATRTRRSDRLPMTVRYVWSVSDRAIGPGC